MRPSASVTVRPRGERRCSCVTTTTVLPSRAELGEQREDRGAGGRIEVAGRLVGEHEREDRSRAPARSRRAAARRPRAPTGSLSAWRRDARRDRSSSSARRAPLPPGSAPQKSIGSMTFSRAVSVGSSWKNWKTMPDRRPRHAASRSWPSSWTAVPPTVTDPAVGRSMPATMFSSVDLPLPDLPTMATNSPASISRSTPRSAGTAPRASRTSCPPLAVRSSCGARLRTPR